MDKRSQIDSSEKEEGLYERHLWFNTDLSIIWLDAVTAIPLEVDGQSDQSSVCRFAY